MLGGHTDMEGKGTAGATGARKAAAEEVRTGTASCGVSPFNDRELRGDSEEPFEEDPLEALVLGVDMGLRH